MQEIIIDEQFQRLLPPLDEETYRLLEESIITYGCMFPLVLWESENILIDGYNRYRICTEHDIPFETVSREFADRDEVIIWIISNQVSRRNLTSMQLSYFRGMHYNAEKRIQGTYDRNELWSKKSQNETFQTSTARRLADQYNVSRNTIIRDSRLAEGINKIAEISPDAKRRILSGETPVNRSKLQALLTKPDEAIAEIAAEIEKGTYERRPLEDRHSTLDVESSLGQALESPEAHRAYPEGNATTGTHQLHVAVTGATNDFRTRWQEMSGTDDIAELRELLQGYIDVLEELYSER